MLNLYIIDSLSQLEKIPISASGDVLAFGIEFDELSQALMKLKHSSLNPLNLHLYVNTANSEIHAFYSNYLMRAWEYDRFAYGSARNSYLPHFLEITENSPFKGKLTNRLFYVSLFSQASRSKNYHRNVILINDKSLKNVLLGFKPRTKKANMLSIFIYFLQIFRFVSKNILLSFVLKSKRPKNSSTENSFTIFSVFPYWWLNAFNQNAEDRFFPKLNLAKMEVKFNYLIWIEMTLLELLTKRNALKSFVIMYGVNSLNFSLKIKNYWEVFRISELQEVLRFRKRILKNNEFVFREKNVSILISEEIYGSITSGEFTRSRLIWRAIQNYFSSFNSKGVIFRFENQPIDRALILGVKGLTKSIGYWHSALASCDNYLSLRYLFPMQENRLVEGVWSAYTPNFMLVPNEPCKENIRSLGMDKKRVFEIGPTRHLDFLFESEKLLMANHGKSRAKTDLSASSLDVIIIFSADPITSRTLLKSSLKVLAKHGNFNVRIRPHPAWKISQSELDSFAEQNNIQIHVIRDGIDLYSFISAAKFVISTGTQLIFEAIYLEIMPIVFEPSANFNPTNFNKFQEACFVCYDEESLQIAIHETLDQGIDFQKKISTWPQMNSRFFGSHLASDPYASFQIALEEIDFKR